MPGVKRKTSLRHRSDAWKLLGAFNKSAESSDLEPKQSTNGKKGKFEGTFITKGECIMDFPPSAGANVYSNENLKQLRRQSERVSEKGADRQLVKRASIESGVPREGKEESGPPSDRRFPD